MDSIKSHTSTTSVIDIRYAYYAVLSSIIFFQILNKCVCRIGTPACVVSSEAKSKWNNLIVSWVHAVICGIWSISCFYKFPQLDLFYSVSYYKYLLVCMTLGYFIYDSYDLYTGQSFKSNWEVFVHHFFICLSLSYHLVNNFLLGYTAVSFLGEVNTVFLHTRKLLQMYKISYDHWLYRTSVWLNLITFVVFRFGNLAWVLHGIVNFNHLLPTYYAFGIFYPCWLVLFLINPILFWRLVRSDLLRPRKCEKPVTNGTYKNEMNGNYPNGIVLNSRVGDGKKLS